MPYIGDAVVGVVALGMTAIPLDCLLQWGNLSVVITIFDCYILLHMARLLSGKKQELYDSRQH